MKLLRRLAIFAIKYNFDYSAVHLEGKRIPKADALSRFRFQVFRALCQNRRRRTNRSRQRSLPRPYIASLDFQWMHLIYKTSLRKWPSYETFKTFGNFCD